MELKNNPFYILGVSTNDNKRKIMDAAEEKLLLMDENVVEDAKNALLDNNKRLEAELAWFPCIDSEDNDSIIAAIDNNFVNSNIGDWICGYDEVNFELEVIRHRTFDKLKNPSAFGMAVSKFAKMFEEYAEWGSDDFSSLYDSIIYNRQTAGFPEITEEELLSHLDERRIKIVSELKSIINELPWDYITSSMTFLAHTATSNAKFRASLLVEFMIDAYDVEIQPFISQQSEKIYAIFDLILGDDANKQTVEKNISTWITKIIDYTLLWSRVVKPIQIISLSKGNEHNISHQILSGIRGVCLTTNNDFDMPKLALNLLVKLNANDVFEYIPSLNRKVANDTNALRKIIREQDEYERQQKEEEKEYNEWANSIFYETEIGLIFKDKLKISAQGIEWNGNITPLYEINGIGWGAIRKSVNGIPTGTDYHIAFQTGNGKIEFSPNKQKYEEITERLWRALAVPIFTIILKRLQDGEIITVGQIKLKDDGVYLINTGWFSSEEKFFSWREPLTIYSEDGSCILAIRDGKYKASASYIYDMNTHIIEFMIRQFFENFNVGNPRLSSLLHGK